MLVFQLPLIEVPHGFGTKGFTVAGFSALGLNPRRVVFLKQVHGSGVLILRQGDPLPDGPPPCDASVTDRSDVILCVRTADCIPLLLWDPLRGVVAAVHVGWRGLIRGVVRKAIEAVVEEFGSEAGELRAAIGPGIRACCYEVGGEVADVFRGRFGEGVLRRRRGHIFLDLPLALRVELESSGVEMLQEVPLCTNCYRPLFHSFRAEGTEARQINFIAKGD